VVAGRSGRRCGLAVMPSKRFARRHISRVACSRFGQELCAQFGCANSIGATLASLSHRSLHRAPSTSFPVSLLLSPDAATRSACYFIKIASLEANDVI
jgi:hypothetical protein